MTLFFTCKSISKSFGSKVLFEDLSFSVFAQDRIGLIGPNGVGKSTLLEALAEKQSIDEGEITRKNQLQIGYVPQQSIFPSKSPQEILIKELQSHANLSMHDKEVQASIWLSKIGLEEDIDDANILSGGWKKRLAIACALITSPDVLLLDEPTNHLDLHGVLWLENFLKKEVTTYVLVSHDRQFLENMTTKIIEINPVYPQGLFAVDCSYKQFLDYKEQFLAGQLRQQQSLQSKLRREMDWLKQSPKARTTKSQSRVDQAYQLMDEYNQIKQRNHTATSKIAFQSSQRETRKLITAKNLSLSFDQKIVFKGIELTLSPKVRLGVIGANGSGKTSFLRVLSAELTPSEGTIKFAEDLRIVYFDQHRNKLPKGKTIKEVLSPSGDFVNYLGKNIHVNSWAQRFLFPKESLDMKIDKLSGGEKARLHMAHLMLTPADVLLLDEPTNDLDIPTLEVLEKSLLEFQGAVALITHDRYMMESICNQFISLDDKYAPELFSTFAQWERNQQPSQNPQKKKEKSNSHQEKKEKKKQSLRCQQSITKKEKELKKLQAKLETMQLDNKAEELTKLCQEIAQLEKEIEFLYESWFEIE